ncbi:MAG: hypothetical protein EBR09_14750, partial [Proteobacteria bacterium]|nr:hypothetical protein [Pseudomonadota bacterium]
MPICPAQDREILSDRNPSSGVLAFSPADASETIRRWCSFLVKGAFMSVRRCVPLLAAGLFGCGPLGISESPRKTDSERSGRADSGQTPPSLKSDKTQQSGNDSGSGDTNSGAAGSGAGGTQGQADAPQQGNNDAGPRAKFSELKASALSFTLPARNFETPANYLWATYYYTPRFSHLADGYELRDLNEVPLGPKLSHRQWCDSAMEGSVQVLMNGTWKTYNYAGTSSSVQVDCSRYFKHPVGRTRFKPAR